jgi:ubiquinone/menaquinone biosynthesis C-methylase UbiE
MPETFTIGRHSMPMEVRMNAFTNGEAYERLMGRWSRNVGTQFLDWLDLPKGLRCLDVGCGNGAFTEVLAARVAPSELAGIDPSEEQLAFAKTREGVKPAQFRVGDAQALPFDDGSFDVAIMALVISFVPDPAKAVSEMARVVGPGGVVATYMWDVVANSQPHGPCYTTMSALGMPIASRPSNASELSVMRSLWEQAGMDSIETRVIEIPVTFSDFDDFWDSNSTPAGPVGKAVEKLSAADRERVRAHLRERLPQDAAGRIAYQARAHAVKGRTAN